MAPQNAQKAQKLLRKVIKEAIPEADNMLDSLEKMKRLFNERQREKAAKKGYSKEQIKIGGQQAAVIKFNQARGLYNFNSNGSQFVVERTEPCLAVVASSTAGNFNLQQIKVFPMSGSFRWLGNMANSFTSYQIQRMEVTYIPSVPTTATGAVSLSFQEDYRDNAPENIEDMLLSEQALYAPVYGGTDGGRYLQQFGSPDGNVVSFEVPKHAYTTGNGVARTFKITSNTNFEAVLASGEGGVAASRELSPGRVWIGTKGAATASQNLGQIFIRYRIKLFGAIAFGLQQ